MDKSLNSTPAASRTHIGFFGRMNAGKSSLINVMTNQPVSIVSPQAGTTTDVVRKAMEIHGIGPCILLDTAGFDDEGDVGKMRVAAARSAAESTDLAVVLFTEMNEWEKEKDWIRYFQNVSTPVLAVLTQTDLRPVRENEKLAERIFAETGIKPVLVSAVTKEGLDELREELTRKASQKETKRYILGNLGRVRIPAMLRKRTGPGLTVDVTAGKDFPEDLDQYDLVIQCGGCMFNRKYVCSRIQRAKDAGVPMTNYGITIAYVKGILDRIDTGR